MPRAATGPSAGSASAPVRGAPMVAAGLVTRVLDYSQHPPGQTRIRTRDAGTPIVYAGVPKKALLQSAPWMALPLLALAGAWWPRRRRTPAGELDEPAARRTARRTLDGRVYILALLGVMGFFAVVGPERTSGYCFNERYFLELLPLGAVAAAWSLGQLRWRPATLAMGLAVGAGLAVVSVLRSWSGEHGWVLHVPLVLAGLVVPAWLARARLGRWSAPVVALGLGWAVAIHVVDDTRAMMQQRATHGHFRDLVARQLDDRPTALFAYWGNTTPFFPLQLDHPLLLVDPFMDGGETARPLIDQLLALGRRVLVLPERMPPAVLDSMLDQRLVRRLPVIGLVVLEVMPSEPSAGSGAAAPGPPTGTRLAPNLQR